MPAVAPLPPFPRWTGMRVTLTSSHATSTALVVDLHVPSITRRAHLWLAWRVLTRQGVPDAAAQQ